MPAFSNKWTVFLLAIIAGVLIWKQNREPDHSPTRETQRPLPSVVESPPASPVETPPPSFPPETPPPTSVETPPPATAQVTVPPTPPVAATPLPATTPPTAAIVIPGSVTDIPAEEDIIADLTAVDSAIRNFQTVHGENPIGSNSEITSALLGNNLKQLKLEVPAGSHVNGEGQMCDRWGTPYFFHQVSATDMEIRSAGPDRKMWTGDDSQM